MGGGGANEGEVDLPKLLQTTTCIFYCLTRFFRKVAIHAPYFVLLFSHVARHIVQAFVPRYMHAINPNPNPTDF